MRKADGNGLNRSQALRRVAKQGGDEVLLPAGFVRGRGMNWVRRGTELSHVINLSAPRGTYFAQWGVLAAGSAPIVWGRSDHQDDVGDALMSGTPSSIRHPPACSGFSTEKELQLLGNMLPLKEKRITSELCVHHLHFTADDYAEKGYLIKCNPAIKAAYNKDALWEALLDDRLDVIATDHAPHLLSEKEPPYEHAHSGLPLVQHSVQLMLYYHSIGKISLEKMVQR